ADAREARGSAIGESLADMELYLLDGEKEAVPIGVSGEMYVGGEGLSRGYLRRPGLTAERFVPHGMGGRIGGRLYRSGDLARYRGDGELEYLGRIDDQVKVRGYRIELGEIEFHLNSHPEVNQCVVIVREDGAAGKRLVAYLVCDEETAPKDGELRDYLKEKLPEYMVP